MRHRAARLVSAVIASAFAALGTTLPTNGAAVPQAPPAAHPAVLLPQVNPLSDGADPTRIVAVPANRAAPATPGASHVVVVDVPRRDSARVMAEMISSGLYSAVDYEAFAEPHFSDTPNDPYFGDPESWGLRAHPGGSFDAAWKELADAGGTWDTATIASIDTGFAMDAPDRGPGIEAGWDYGENDPDVTPRLGVPDGQHGTGTAGIMGAATDNGLGGSGATWNNRILIYKASDANGALRFSAVTNSIMAATDAGAKVIVLSLGSPDFPSYVQTAIDQAISRGVTIVASSGNYAQDTLQGQVNPVQYPAAYEPVISVAAVNPAGGWADFSTYNSGVDIAAPGVGILVMDQEFPDGHAVADGTSEAAPFVAATAALMLRERPGLSANQIQNVLCATATDVSVAPAAPGRDPYTGCGIVNAHAAVVAARNAPIVPTFSPENNGIIEATAGDNVSLRLGVQGDPYPVLDISDATPLPGAISLGHDGRDWVLHGQAQKAGTFTVDVIADSRGEQAVLPVTIAVQPGPVTQVRPIPSTYFMKNTQKISVRVSGTDQFGNPAPGLTPAELSSAKVKYSFGPRCRFATGKKPSYRVCTISVSYSGSLQPVPEKVGVYDTKQFEVAVKGTLRPGKKITASVPAGWKGLTYRWYMDGRPIPRASERTYTIPKDVAKGAKFQIQVKVPGVAVKKSFVVKVGKAIPELKVKKKKKALVVRVKAAGIKSPTGTVVVHYGSKSIKTRLKAKDSGVVMFDMPKGRYKVSVEYLGSAKISRTSTRSETYKF